MLSRRAFLGASTTALAVSVAGQARAAPPGLGSVLGLAPASAVDAALLPSAAELHAEVAAMVALGPRLTGTPAHNRWIDTLEAGFAAAGATVTRDRFTFTRWSAERWGLEVAGASVPVSSYFPYSGSTSAAGLEAPLAYIGPVPLPSVSGDLLDLRNDVAALGRWGSELAANLRAAIATLPGGVRGRILLLDAPPLPLPAAIFEALATYTYDPDNTIRPWSDFHRAWTAAALAMVSLNVAKSLGAVGAVLAMDASAGSAAGQYIPYGQPVFGIPALYVDRDTGRRLRALAAGHPRTRLTLVARVTPNTPTDNLVGFLPGDGSTNEVLILNTHTDGQNAFEENGGIALVALARYFAARGRAARRRTLVFSAHSGHFGPGLPQTVGLIERHPDLIKRAAASLNLEHFGATEWLDDLRGYRPSGRNEPAILWHSVTPIALPAIASVRARDLRRTFLDRPTGNSMLAVGTALHSVGVPTLSYITGPDYLVSVAADGHLDKLDPNRFRRELIWSADVLERLDRMPAALLRAGDATVLGNDGGLTRSGP